MTDKKPAEAPKEGAERRCFFRMDAALPFRHRPVRPGEFEAVRLQIETSVNAEPLESESEETQLLARIDAKLDLLVAMLDPDRPRPVSDHDLRSVEISGSGARFASTESQAKGDDLLIDFALPGCVPRHIRTLARVASCTPSQDRAGMHQIAVSFEVIDELDRDAIVRYLLLLQRRARRPTGRADVQE